MHMSLSDLCTRITFFITAFILLWAIVIGLALFTYSLADYWFVYTGIILLIMLCWAQVRIQIRNYETYLENKKKIIIKSKNETIHKQVLSITPYFLAIISLDMQISNLIVLLSIFFIIGILYVRTNMVFTNPMLFLVGIRIFKITYVEPYNEDNDKTSLLLTKRSPWRGDELEIKSIANGVFIQIN